MQYKTINGYTLLRKLGEGGMAEVWYAENDIEKQAAIKILRKDLSFNDDVVARFKNEARVMVKLNHPNIRQVYDYATIDNRPCIIMEYLEGNDLSNRLKQGERFNHDQLVKWWNQMVEALQYTQAKEIIHRDIKPSNIFITNKGNVKLLDFGIAKIKDSITVTQTGTRMGTLMYMSPEQIKDSKHLDYRTDLYSLAVTFYHLITGTDPYDNTSSSEFEIQTKIVTEPLNLKLLPKDWKLLLSNYLDKEPSRRSTLKSFSEESTIIENEKSIADQQDKTIFEKDKTDYKKTSSPPITLSDKKARKKKSLLPIWIGIGIIALIISFVVFNSNERLIGLSENGLNNRSIWNDLKDNNLHGNVKSIHDCCYEADKINGEIITGKLESKELTIFDRNGNIEVFSSNFESYRNENKYDSKGNKIESIKYDSDGSISYIVTYIYDEYGNMIEYSGKYPDGKLFMRDISRYNKDGFKIEETLFFETKIASNESYRYDDIGNMIESISYKSDGRISHKFLYKRDEHGNLIESKLYNANGIIDRVWSCEYKYDKRGNWINQIRYDDNNPTSITERVIEYFD